MRRRQAAASLFVFCGCLLAVGWAHATERVVALVPEMNAGSYELHDRFQDAVARSLKSPDLDVLSASEVRLRLGMVDSALLSCPGTAACVTKVADTLHATRVVATEIRVLGKDYQIRLSLFDASGRLLSHADESCEICTVNEAEQACGKAVHKLGLHPSAAAAPAPTPVAPPPSAPPPAPPGKPTPEKPETAAKTEKSTTVAKTEKSAKREKPKVVEKSPEPPAKLNPTPKQPVPPTGRKWLALGVAGTLLGVAMIGTGAGLVAIDGRPTCGPEVKGVCMEVNDTAKGGGALIGLGALSMAASGVFYYLDYRERKGTPVRAVIGPTSGGAMLVVGGQF